ncbi:MAG: hypothetical protein H5T86_09460 [Armatimonadetes bacterium]|nr:hypothetical protein [Armatimonadota bacterium]
MRKARLHLIAGLTLAAWLALTVSGQSQEGAAYCYIRSVNITALSNGVQIMVKADGILNWAVERGYRRALREEEKVDEIAIRFPDARLALDKTLYNVDQYPVSSVVFYVPQDAIQGLGVVMQVSMTEPSRVSATLSEDRQTFMLTVLGERTVERAKAGTAAPAPGAEGYLEVVEHDGLLTVRCTKADIHRVVAEIAAKGKIGVAVDDAVQHKVSLNLVDMPPIDIIRGIAAGYGLALSQVQDVYMLSEGVPSDLPTYRRSGTGSFPMKYLKAGDAVQLLPPFLFKYVHFNPEQNAVVVTAPSQMLDKVRSDLEAIDIAPPIIMVEAMAIEVSNEGELTAGLTWSYQSREHETQGSTESGDVYYHERQVEDGLATAIADTAKLQARIQALLTKGQAVIRAHPRMAAVNGKYARLFIGQQRFIKVQYLQWGQQQERIETVPVGVQLSIRPWTGGNEEITSWLQVEVSNIVQIDPETGLPRLSTRRAQTTVRTRDGETIVIGGLLQRQSEKTYRKIPLLGDLPIIGPLFRSQSTVDSTTQLIILVRPRLLDNLGRLPAEEQEALKRQFLQPADLGYTPGQPAPTSQAVRQNER